MGPFPDRSNRKEDMTREALEQSLVADICKALELDIERFGKASLLVSGGSTPVDLFQQLSTKDIDWSNVQVSLVDERFLPEGHKDLNATLVQDNLLKNNARNAKFYPLVINSEDSEENLSEVRTCIEILHRPFSMVILGMGSDGHSASLFADAPQLESGMTLTTTDDLIITTPKTAPYERITFTRRALLNTRRLVLHCYGNKKKAVLDEAKEHKDFHIHPIAGFLDFPQTPLDIRWTE